MTAAHYLAFKEKLVPLETGACACGLPGGRLPKGLGAGGGVEGAGMDGDEMLTGGWRRLPPPRRPACRGGPAR